MSEKSSNSDLDPFKGQHALDVNNFRYKSDTKMADHFFPLKIRFQRHLILCKMSQKWRNSDLDFLERTLKMTLRFRLLKPRANIWWHLWWHNKSWKLWIWWWRLLLDLIHWSNLSRLPMSPPGSKIVSKWH